MNFSQTSVFVLLACLGVACSDSNGNSDDIGSNVGSGDGGLNEAGAADDGQDPNNTVEPGPDDPDYTEEDGGLFGGGAPTITVEEPPPAASEMPDGPAPDPNAPNADNPLVQCASAVGLGDDPRIDDFEDHDEFILAIDNRDGGWYDYDDDSNDPQLVEWLAEPGSSDGSLGVMHVQSSGYGEYSGVGFGLRWTETGAEHCYYDASYYDGIEFAVRGNGGLRIALQNPAVRPVAEGGTCAAGATCYDSHGYNFTAGANWATIRVSFENMKQAGWGTPAGVFDPTQLFTAEFQFVADSAYEIWLDDVRFYKEGEPEPLPSDEAGAPMLDAGVGTLDAGAMPDGGGPATEEAGDAAAGVLTDASVDASL